MKLRIFVQLRTSIGQQFEQAMQSVSTFFKEEKDFLYKKDEQKMNFKPLLQTKFLWITLILLSIIAIVFKSSYRQYIYANKINDYGIADSSPNFFAGLIIVFFYFTQYQQLTLKKHAIFTVVGLVGYELIQGSVFKHNFFDYKDIFASFLGAFIGYLISFKFKSGPIFNNSSFPKGK